MSTEVQVLALSALLAAAMLCALAVAANLTMPPRWLAGPRDEPRQLPPLAGRLDRAFRNHLEGLLMFAVAVMAVEHAGANSAVTATAAQVYLAARVVYGPLYAAGIPWLRSIAWAFGFAATITLLIAALFAGP